MNKRQDKKPSVFQQEVRRDMNTFKRLSGKKKIRFLWDYFRFKIIAAIAILIILISASIALYQGQQPCRLRICVVLNNDMDCEEWFNDFYKILASDGNNDKCDLNQDQPFDYSNKYYYLHEIEVMTTISSQRMDVAICGPDMYEYLLSLNACLSLNEALSADVIRELSDRDILISSTAGLQYQEDGTLDETNAVDGIFAIDISDTKFGRTYNAGQAPLYAVIISNTDHITDAVTLLEEISK